MKEDWPSRDQDLQQLKVDSSIHLLKKLEFNKTLNQLKDSNYDIREFLVLFPDFYSELQKGNNIF